MTKKQYILSFAAAALTAVLLTGCSGDSASDISPDPTPSTGKSEIKVNADIWRMMEGTRVTTYDNQAALQTDGHFTCAVYQANTTTPYINATRVDWNGSTAWEFTDGKHYWPATGNLDFFAYMPKAGSLPSYITTGPTYAVNGTPAPAPYFVCTNLPMTNAGQEGLQEFIWALTPGQNKASQGASGVTMTFKHPFALIKFVIAEGSGTHVQVNSISITELNTGGTCTFNAAGTASTWSSHSGSATMTITPATPLKYGTSSTQTTLLMVIPNNYNGSKTLTVNGTWDDWSNVTKDISTDISIDWQPGYIYTYTLTVTKYALTVDIQKYTEQW